MVKAFIQSVENDGYSYRVRIPIYHKLKNTPGAIPDDRLPIAPVVTLPGVKTNYSVGDVVWVDFENKELGLPVIVGYLLAKSNTSSTIDVECNSLTTISHTDLSEHTNIGNTTAENFSALPQIYSRSIEYGEIIEDTIIHPEVEVEPISLAEIDRICS